MKFYVVFILGVLVTGWRRCLGKTIFDGANHSGRVSFMPNYYGAGGGETVDEKDLEPETNHTMTPANSSSLVITLKKVPIVEDHFEIRLTKTIKLESNSSEASVQDTKDAHSGDNKTAETLTSTELHANSTAPLSLEEGTGTVISTCTEDDENATEHLEVSDSPAENAPTAENDKPSTNTTFAVTEKADKDNGHNETTKVLIDDRINFGSNPRTDQVARR